MIIGDAMKSIEIIVNGLGYEKNLLIDCKKNRIVINNRIDFISQEKIDELLRIIRLWENHYSGDLIDGDSFFIKINMENGYDIINGHGGYPENYLSFKEWISGFHE